MANGNDTQTVEAPAPPQPDPALRRLDRLVGTWTMEGNLVGSDEKNIGSETSFPWLPGSSFLEQRARIDFMGRQIDDLELSGYDAVAIDSGSSPTGTRSREVDVTILGN
jgi:hypothetical protein